MAVPDFIIIGAPKCGTTWMMRNFGRQYDRIVFPEGAQEIDFFNFRWESDIDWGKSLRRFKVVRKRARAGLGWYKSLFPEKESGDILYGEKCPSYIFALDRERVNRRRRYVHSRMREIVPDAKLILSLRNPVDRAFSHWHMRRTQINNYDTSFEEAVALDRRNMEDERYQRFSGEDFVQKGFYMEYIENLLQQYPREQLHVCITEELKADITGEYAKILRFIGVEPREDAEYRVAQRAGKNSGYKFPFEPEIRADLEALYRPYNERLFEFLGRDVPAWRPAA